MFILVYSCGLFSRLVSDFRRLKPQNLYRTRKSAGTRVLKKATLKAFILCDSGNCYVLDTLPGCVCCFYEAVDTMLSCTKCNVM